MQSIDATHEPGLTSWVESAEDHPEFPIQNLPFGRFRRSDDSNPELGVAIGDQILPLEPIAAAGLVSQRLTGMLRATLLNPLMAASPAEQRELRRRLSQLLDAQSVDSEDPNLAAAVAICSEVLIDQTAVTMMVPCAIGDYTDFYASLYHATNVGSMFRPDNPLLPNYKHIPIGYHGRASSIVASGATIRRPSGQLAPAEEGGRPSFEPCKLLDYELEVGALVGRGNPLGQSISIDDAESHLFGMCLVNDWSARDIQRWEYQPLGPFLAKSFATSISPWVVTMEALAPFRVPAFERAAADPQPLDYLSSESNQQLGGVDLTLEVYLRSSQMRAQGMDPLRISRGSFRDMYWTLAQMLTHHSSNGCNLKPGDLLASGTVSGAARESRGCLLEMTWDGELGNVVPGSQRTPIKLPTDEERTFLANGDEISFKGFCENQEYRRIGFGTVLGTIAEE